MEGGWLIEAINHPVIVCLYGFFEFFAGFEFDDITGFDFDGRPGLRIPAHACLATSFRECAETYQGDSAVLFLQRFGDAIHK